jgi:hypothetical protein
MKEAFIYSFKSLCKVDPNEGKKALTTTKEGQNRFGNKNRPFRPSTKCQLRLASLFFTEIKK